MKVSQLNNVRVRFAPSPTGELHLGSARTALFNYLFAKNNQGKFLLRIEDTDTERSKKEHIDQAINTLKWLGFKPDEEIVFQSHRLSVYKKYLKPEVLEEDDFSLLRTKTDPDRIIYIKKILQNRCDFDEDIRVKYANIHTVKGLTFDNVIVDLTRTRKEEYFTQLRLKYVAYSRGRVDCWTITSKGPFTLGVK